MREQQGVQRGHAATAQELLDASARRPGVDERAQAGCLDQGGVALPDVQERDPEGSRRRRRGSSRGPGEPEQQPGQDARKCSGGTPPHEPGGHASEYGEQERAPRQGAVDPCTAACDEADVGAERPHRTVERDRRPGRHGPEQAGCEREPQQRCDGGQRKQVGGQAAGQGCPAEVHERDRRGRERARQRDGEWIAHAQRHRRALQPRADARRQAVDGRNRHERELKARPDDRPGVESQDRRCGEREQVPGIACRADQPGQRHEHAGGGGADDGRPSADDRRVRNDRGDGAAVRERPRHARDPGQSEHRGHEQHDVAARDGQQVRQPGCAECLERALVQGRRAPERDTGGDAHRLLVASGRERGAGAAAQVIEHALDAAAPAERHERAGGQRLVHALARQPGAPVEAIRGGRHRGEGAADLNDRPLLQRPARSQLDGMAGEARDRRAAVGAASRLAVDHDPGRGDVPDERAQRIGGARGEPVRRPRCAQQHAGHGDERDGRGRAPGALQQREEGQDDERPAGCPRGGERGQGEPDREPRRRLRAELVDGRRPCHSASVDRSSSRRTGPMPLTSSSSSTERNPPCATR